MKDFKVVFHATLKSIVRDRLLQISLVCALVMFLMVPVFSIFSMRQVQELSVTLSLSVISLVILVFSIILGATSVWRDLDRRYLVSIFGLPISRSSYILGKFAGIVLFIIVGSLSLGFVAVTAILVVSSQYPSETAVRWFPIVIAIFFDCLKYILVIAIALFFSALSTSFYLPFFATVVIYFCGNASQEVYEYILSDYGKTMSVLSLKVITFLYYIIPNLTAFDYKTQAVYKLPISLESVFYTAVYFICYTSILLMTTIWVFKRREFA